MSIRGEKRLAYGAWAAVCVIWGTTYLGIRISLETMPPLLMGGLRWSIAGTLLAVGLLARGMQLPPRADWGALAVMGLLFIVLGNGGVVWAEQTVPSGFTALVLATSPFWMIGIEACLPQPEVLTARRAVGLLVGFCGILLLVWPDLRTHSGSSASLGPGILALQIACAGWALGSSYSRRHAPEGNALAAAALEMAFGGCFLLVAGSIRGEWAHLSFTARTASAFAYLTVIGAVGGFAAYIYALKHLPVSFVSLYAFINPVIAVVLGILVLGEPFGVGTMAAGAVVLAGLAIVRS